MHARQAISSACLQGVWASKYNERAFLSMKKVGLNFLDLRMAVLVHRVVPAAYASVIQTENPTSGAKDEIFAELVQGLGESIVSGMVPGSALSFYAKKDSLDKPEFSCTILRWLVHDFQDQVLGLSVVGVHSKCSSILVCCCILNEVMSSTFANVGLQLSIELHNTGVTTFCGAVLNLYKSAAWAGCILFVTCYC